MSLEDQPGNYRAKGAAERRFMNGQMTPLEFDTIEKLRGKLRMTEFSAAFFTAQTDRIKALIVAVEQKDAFGILNNQRLMNLEASGYFQAVMKQATP